MIILKCMVIHEFLIFVSVVFQRAVPVSRGFYVFYSMKKLREFVHNKCKTVRIYNRLAFLNKYRISNTLTGFQLYYRKLMSALKTELTAELSYSTSATVRS